MGSTQIIQPDLIPKLPIIDYADVCSSQVSGIFYQTILDLSDTIYPKPENYTRSTPLSYPLSGITKIRFATDYQTKEEHNDKRSLIICEKDHQNFLCKMSHFHVFLFSSTKFLTIQFNRFYLIYEKKSNGSFYYRNNHKTSDN